MTLHEAVTPEGIPDAVRVTAPVGVTPPVRPLTVTVTDRDWVGAMLDEAGVTDTAGGWMKDALMRQATGAWAEPLYAQYSVEDAQVEGQPLPGFAPRPQ